MNNSKGETKEESLLECEEVLGMAASIAALMNELIEIRSVLSGLRESGAIPEGRALTESIDSIIDLLPQEGRTIGEAVRQCIVQLTGLVALNEMKQRIDALSKMPSAMIDYAEYEMLKKTYEATVEERWLAASQAVEAITELRTMDQLRASAYKLR